MSIGDNTKALFVNFYNRATQALPECGVIGIVSAAITLAGIALKVHCFAFNPLAAGIFCAAAHFLRKTIVEPLCQKFVDTSRVHGDFKRLAPLVITLAISQYAIGVIAPSMAVDFAKGTMTYAASLLSLSIL
ncbi:MAG: hypothetical protein H0W50_03990 [Parachlamydiaceae bacterium]|nr:hypothetical protein [Parachlamydiaceae bacterium]